jgi:hypothetical protein
MQLSPIHLYAKPASHEDFAWSGGKEPPAGVRAAARAWFLCHAEGPGDGQTIAIVRDSQDGSLWLLRVAADGTDASGRVAHLLVVGRFVEPAAEFDLGSALMAALVKRLPDRLSMETQNCKLPSPKSGWHLEPERVPGLLAQRVLGLAEVLTAGSPTTVGALNERLGIEAFEWFATSSTDMPPTALPPGPGVLIASRPVDGPQAPAELQALFKNDTISFADLLHAAPDPVRRRALAELAVIGRDSNERAFSGPLTDAELDWVLTAASPAGRIEALRRADPAQVDRFIRDHASISREELEAVEDRLDPGSEGQARTLAPLMARYQQRERFRTIFGADAPGLDQFLSPQARACWCYLLTPENAPEPSQKSRAAALEELSESNMVSRLPLHTFARFRRWPILNTAFPGRLVEEGLPEALVDWVCNGKAPADPIVAAPTLEPHADWIAYLDAERIETLGQWMTASTEASRWWRAALAAHPDLRDLESTERPGSWRIARGWLAVAEVREGRRSREEFLVALLRWRMEGSALWSDDTAAEMLRRTGFSPSAFEHMVSDAGDNDTATGLILENLAWLHDRGLVDPAPLFRRLQPKQIAQTLDDARLEPNLRALLDLGSFGPPEPPIAGVPEVFSAALLRVLGTREFWARWQNGIPCSVLEWLERQTGSAPEQQVVAAVQSARTGETLPESATLAVVADALSSDAAIHLLLMAAAAGREPEARTLLSSKALQERPPLQEWLFNRLFYPTQATPPLPPLTDAELRALLPALAPHEIAQTLAESPVREHPADGLPEAIANRLRSPCILSRLAQLPPYVNAYFQILPSC